MNIYILLLFFFFFLKIYIRINNQISKMSSYIIREYPGVATFFSSKEYLEIYKGNKLFALKF